MRWREVEMNIAVRVDAEFLLPLELLPGHENPIQFPVYSSTDQLQRILIPHSQRHITVTHLRITY